ncbi:MAG: MaoC/PaaZ C-terminal domain-containing protein, partial [Acidimicrobiales bacterium]
MAATPTPKLAWDDVEVGAEAPAVAHQLGRTDLVKYAGASGDYNPMHTDEVAAQAAGLPSVF